MWEGWKCVEGVRCVCVCVCVCVEGVEVCGRSKVCGWWEHVCASIVYRCLHMYIVCVLCVLCVCVFCVCFVCVPLLLELPRGGGTEQGWPCM